MQEILFVAHMTYRYSFHLGPSWAQADYGCMALDRTNFGRTRLYTSKDKHKLD